MAPKLRTLFVAIYVLVVMLSLFIFYLCNRLSIVLYSQFINCELFIFSKYRSLGGPTMAAAILVKKQDNYPVTCGHVVHDKLL